MTENKDVRVMTIVVNVNDEHEMTIISSNLEGPCSFYQEQIRFLERTLEVLKEKGDMLRKQHDEFQSFSWCFSLWKGDSGRPFAIIASFIFYIFSFLLLFLYFSLVAIPPLKCLSALFSSNIFLTSNAKA